MLEGKKSLEVHFSNRPTPLNAMDRYLKQKEVIERLQAEAATKQAAIDKENQEAEKRRQKLIAANKYRTMYNTPLPFFMG